MQRDAKKWLFLIGLPSFGAVLVLAAIIWNPFRGDHGDGQQAKVVINEAIRTPLYLPLYHAQEMGYFKDEGVDVRIVTGGTSTASIAAMLSGEADFAQADPMYSPISRERGSNVTVVAQVAGRIALWCVTRDNGPTEMTASTLKGKRIATQPQPMSGYTYTVGLLDELKLKPDQDVRLITGAPGTEVAALFKGEADFMVSTEPLVAQAEQNGCKVVLSFPQKLGDRVFSGLMAKEDVIKSKRPVVLKVVKAFQRSLADIHAHPEAALVSAKKYFPQLPDAVLRRSITRLTADLVFPQSVLVSEESWNAALQARLQIGDIKKAISRSECCDLSIMEGAAK